MGGKFFRRYVNVNLNLDLNLDLNFNLDVNFYGWRLSNHSTVVQYYVSYPLTLGN